jgi:purine-binding chemotaxis protein CheW
MSGQRNFLIFGTAQRKFACAFEDILRIEAARESEITPAPGFPEYMPGTAKIDGEIIPVIDAAKRFGLGNGGDRSHSCFIVTFTDGGDEISDKYKKCALLADSVMGSVQCGEEDLLPPPEVNADSAVKYVKGMTRLDGETVYIISPEKTIG